MAQTALSPERRIRYFPACLPPLAGVFREGVMIITTVLGDVHTPQGDYEIGSGNYTTVIFATAGGVRIPTACEIIINGVAVAHGVTADFNVVPSISPQTIGALIPYLAKAVVRISQQDAGRVVVNQIPLGLSLEPGA
jgi:hypothetical protein